MSGHSTPFPLIRNIDGSTEKINNGNYVDILYIAFQETFDSKKRQKFKGKILTNIHNMILELRQKLLRNKCKCRIVLDGKV